MPQSPHPQTQTQTRTQTRTQTQSQSQTTAIAAARMRLVHSRPYLAAALWALTPVPKPGLGTLAVDRFYRLYYDPEAVAAWAGEQLAGVLYHEVLHLLRGHPERCQAVGGDHLVWNIAADAEINDDLVGEGVSLPEGAVLPRRLGLPDGRLAEEYYAELVRRQPTPPPPAGQGSGQADGTGAPRPASASPSPDGPPADAGAEGASPGSGGTDGRGVTDPATGTSSPAADADADTRPAPAAGRCGSAATGSDEAWEAGPPGTDGASAGVTPAEARVIRRQVAQAVEQAARGRGRGTVPDHLRRWAEGELSPPRVPWQKVLAAAVRAAVADVAGAVDYSYRRPSRRQGAVTDVVLPALRRPVPEVAVVVDTSGSMTDADLAAALAEVQGVLRAVGAAGARVLAFDAALHADRRVHSARQARRLLTGGGGTDMAAAIAAALAGRPRPQVIVVITDGDTPWPSRPVPAKVRVIACLTSATGPRPPAWVRTVTIA